MSASGYQYSIGTCTEILYGSVKFPFYLDLCYWACFKRKFCRKKNVFWDQNFRQYFIPKEQRLFGWWIVRSMVLVENKHTTFLPDPFTCWFFSGRAVRFAFWLPYSWCRSFTGHFSYSSVGASFDKSSGGRVKIIGELTWLYMVMSTQH